MVDDSMKQEIFKRLDAIGEKLGVAASHIWQVLVRQGIAEGIANIVLCAILVIIAVILVKTTKRSMAAHKAESDEQSGYSDKGGGYMALTVFLYGGALISTIFALNLLYAGILLLVNPEYFALQTLMKLLGK